MQHFPNPTEHAAPFFHGDAVSGLYSRQTFRETPPVDIAKNSDSWEIHFTLYPQPKN